MYAYDLNIVSVGEVARLKSYITQRPPFDVKNPYLTPVRVNRNLHKARQFHFADEI